MLKTLCVAVLGLVALGSIAQAQVGVYGDVNAAVVIGHQPNYGRPGYQPIGGVSASRTCPPGTTPMGTYGCAGPTITDPRATQVHNQHIASGCVPGARRTIWKTGTDASGRRVRWKIEQHAECGYR